MGHVDDGLDKTLIGHVAEFIDEKRQNDGGGEGEKQLEYGNGDGVAENAQEGRVVEKCVEVFESNPGAAPDPVHQLVLLEGDDVAEHGVEAEDDEEDKWQDKHQVEIAVRPSVEEQLRPNAPTAARCADGIGNG